MRHSSSEHYGTRASAKGRARKGRFWQVTSASLLALALAIVFFGVLGPGMVGAYGTSAMVLYVLGGAVIVAVLVWMHKHRASAKDRRIGMALVLVFATALLGYWMGILGIVLMGAVVVAWWIFRRVHRGVRGSSGEWRRGANVVRKGPMERLLLSVVLVVLAGASFFFLGGTIGLILGILAVLILAGVWARRFERAAERDIHKV